MRDTRRKVGQVEEERRRVQCVEACRIACMTVAAVIFVLCFLLSFFSSCPSIRPSVRPFTFFCLPPSAGPSCYHSASCLTTNLRCDGSTCRVVLIHALVCKRHPWIEQRTGEVRREERGRGRKHVYTGKQID